MIMHYVSLNSSVVVATCSVQNRVCTTEAPDHVQCGWRFVDNEWLSPPTPVPLSIHRRQRNLWLGGARMLQIKAAINAIADADDKHQAAVHFNDAETTERYHPFTLQFAAVIGLTAPEQIDQAFIEASQL